MNQYYHILTYGCQMNERDTEILAGMLQDIGYVQTETEAEADLVLLNTCSVRETAENKVWGKMGELTHLKAANPDVILGICGCMTQQPAIAERIKEKVPHMDIVFGTHNIHVLPDLIRRVKEERGPIVEVWASEGAIVENLPTARAEGVKAFVTIMYGCNNFCTYCIVPHVRGRERSRQVKDIVSEITRLAQEGYKEITLLGQNVNSYGKDFESKVDFADLLVEVNKIEGVERIRYTSSHPRDFTDKLIQTIPQCDKVCESIHLPVQAGSNRILQKMNRGYNREYYLELVEKIKSTIPGVTISTDLIVGFPGETEEDFQDTLDLLSQVKYQIAYTFVYNKRTGTPAAEYTEQVDEDTKKDRIQRLISFQNDISLAGNRQDEGQVVEILVEGPSRTNPEVLTGRTRTNRIVNFSGPQHLIGQLVNVKITLAKTWNLEGMMV